jgi:hypothetical protein
MKNLVSGGLHLASLLVGLLVYGVTRRTPGFAYRSMIRVFGQTRGVSNEMLARLLRLTSRPQPIDSASGVAGPLAPGEAARIAREIDEKGYHVFAQRISPEICRRIVEHSFAMPAQLLEEGAEESEPAPFDPASSTGVAYDCVPDVVIADEAVQAIIADESLMAVAQAYLQCAPVLSHVNLRWSTASPAPDKEAAQYFHFDMDRIRWLEFFVYLTDVDEEMGPHQFVVGSHKPQGIPAELLAHGYARLPDAEVRQHYPADRIVEFTGTAGTIIAEDTRGLHKGTALRKGRRLMLNFEWANSMFGNKYDTLPMPAHASAPLQTAVSRYPGMFALLSRE